MISDKDIIDINIYFRIERKNMYEFTSLLNPLCKFIDNKKMICSDNKELRLLKLVELIPKDKWISTERLLHLIGKKGNGMSNRSRRLKLLDKDLIDLSNFNVIDLRTEWNGNQWVNVVKLLKKPIEIEVLIKDED